MQPRVSLLTKAFKQLKFTESIRKKLIDSLGFPLRELIDTILESLIYCDTPTSELYLLIKSLLQMRDTVEIAISGSDSKQMIETYTLAIRFLGMIDQLDPEIFESLAGTIRDTFHFFQVFFKSYQMMSELVKHLEENKECKTDPFFNQLTTKYLNCNEQWYVEIISHSMMFQEYLTNELQIYSRGTDDEYLTSSRIINSETFQQFITKRKQRLLNESIVNKFSSYII
ncbi:hypothetical protein C6P45_000040 [Maudiozyma exigua]|uniref:Uncharacterized protein n=1 Tax=Maudiozyma exigua TaxID=34358 RepID=A0A9P6WFH7_MAUEX|nr:hypothetical protein C6P45_000040 [Kazachstania exigua]